MNKKAVKFFTLALALVVVSTVGFSSVYGYGGSSGGRSGGSRTPVVSNAGQVLGAETFAFTSDLRLGMSGNDVRELQERLRKEGFFTFATSTGYFGPITFAAVKAYQTAHPEIGFVTGFVGPLTRAVLNK